MGGESSAWAFPYASTFWYQTNTGNYESTYWKGTVGFVDDHIGWRSPSCNWLRDRVGRTARLYQVVHTGSTTASLEIALLDGARIDQLDF